MEMKVTPEANSEIQNMRDHCGRIRMAFGSDHGYTIDAYASLATVLAQVFNLGGSVARNSELSIICNYEFITYGVVFLPARGIEDEEWYNDVKEANALPGEFLFAQFKSLIQILSTHEDD